LDSSTKVAIVTGASRGIGRSVALGLAQDGFAVALVARGREELESLASKLDRRAGVGHSVHPADIGDAAAIETTFKEILNRHGRVDALVNNAGIYLPGSLDLRAAELEGMLRVNLLAPFLFMRAALPVMKAQASGHVFNIASRAGKVGFSGDGGYVASKFGLVGLSESVYRQFAESGISVTAIGPGGTDTDMAQDAGTPLSAEEMIQPADIVETIRWLLRLTPAARVREVILECRRSIA